MPVIKPTLSSVEEQRYSRIVAALITQLKRAKQISEPIHTGPYQGQHEGKVIRYDYTTLIEQLEALNVKEAPNPFLLQLAYAAIGQRSFADGVTTPGFFNAETRPVDTLLKTMVMLPNPVLVMLLRSITYDLTGETCWSTYIYPEKDTLRFSHQPMEKKVFNFDPYVKASYEGLETSYTVKTTRVKKYQNEPEGMWAIEGVLPKPRTMRKPTKKAEFNTSYLSTYTEDVNKQLEIDCNYLTRIANGERTGSVALENRYRPKYQYEEQHDDSWIFWGQDPSTKKPLQRLEHIIPCDKNCLPELAVQTEALRKAIIDNERWYQEKGYEYAYYFRYLFNAYKAYDEYDTAYQTIRQKQGVFGMRLPVEPLLAIKAVKNHVFDKLMILAEIKLNQGWQEVVNKGERVDLKEIFGEWFDLMDKKPAFACMKKLFQSDQWCFLQGKIANALIYYQKHPGLVNKDDFEALAQFASHLLKHHSDMIKKDVKKQLIVLGIILSLAAAGLAVALAPAGPAAHVVAGSVEAAVIAEVIVGLAHLSHGLHDALHKVKHIQITGRELPLGELRQELQHVLHADQEATNDPDVDEKDALVPAPGY